MKHLIIQYNETQLDTEEKIEEFETMVLTRVSSLYKDFHIDILAGEDFKIVKWVSGYSFTAENRAWNALNDIYEELCLKGFYVETNENEIVETDEAPKTNTYCNSNGKYQKQLNVLEKELVPEDGKAITKYGELLRCTINCYYDFYDNGGCNWYHNISKQFDYIIQNKVTFFPYIDGQDLTEKEFELLLSGIKYNMDDAWNENKVCDCDDYILWDVCDCALSSIKNDLEKQYEKLMDIVIFYAYNEYVYSLFSIKQEEDIEKALEEILIKNVIEEETPKNEIKIEDRIQTPNLTKRLKKANILATELKLINQHSTATAYINSSSSTLYQTHVNKQVGTTKNIRHKTYTCGCMNLDTACTGNTSTKTVCYHVLATLIAMAKENGKKILFSDKPKEFKKFVRGLPRKPVYIKIVNRQNNNQHFLWGIVLKD